MQLNALAAMRCGIRGEATQVKQNSACEQRAHSLRAKMYPKQTNKASVEMLSLWIWNRHSVVCDEGAEQQLLLNACHQGLRAPAPESSCKWFAPMQSHVGARGRWLNSALRPVESWMSTPGDGSLESDIEIKESGATTRVENSNQLYLWSSSALSSGNTAAVHHNLVRGELNDRRRDFHNTKLELPQLRARHVP